MFLPDEAKVVLAGQLELLSCGLLVESQFIRSLDKSFDGILEDDSECKAHLKSKKGTSVDPNLIANVEAKVKEFKETAGSCCRLVLTSLLVFLVGILKLQGWLWLRSLTKGLRGSKGAQNVKEHGRS